MHEQPVEAIVLDEPQIQPPLQEESQAAKQLTPQEISERDAIRERIAEAARIVELRAQSIEDAMGQSSVDKEEHSPQSPSANSSKTEKSNIWFFMVGRTVFSCYRLDSRNPMKKIVDNNIQSFAKIVKEWSLTQPRVSKAYLFASRVKNTHRDNSDLDIAVEFLNPWGKPGQFCDWGQLGPELKSTLSALIHVKLHLVQYENEIQTPEIHAYILEASILVYSRDHVNQ